MGVSGFVYVYEVFDSFFYHIFGFVELDPCVVSIVINVELLVVCPVKFFWWYILMTFFEVQMDSLIWLRSGSHRHLFIGLNF